MKDFWAPSPTMLLHRGFVGEMPRGVEATQNICVLRIFTSSLNLSKHRCQVFDNLEAKGPGQLLSEANGKDSIAGCTHNLVNCERTNI